MDSELYALSALDGRYRGKVSDLAPVVSEAGLISYRIRVEAAWLAELAEAPEIRADLKISPKLAARLKELASEPPAEALVRVKELERTTNHDVKAVEYYLREELTRHGADERVLAFIHFACTSEDINNLSYALMLRDVREHHIGPRLATIIERLTSDAARFADLPMLARTHGQTASPTTLGKELAVFAHRLEKTRVALMAVKLEGKMSGAVGNYNAHYAAYPSIDWPALSRRFIEGRLGLTQNPLTTQIENHDSMVELVDVIRRANVILIGFCRDMWGYISLGYFRQQVKANEVGSSTMPHKVNPIDFENAEGNLGVSVALCQHFAEKLPISRWQRDLSDSTVQRVLGTMVGHTVLAYRSLERGLERVDTDLGAIARDLDKAWEVLAEPVQTVMRRYGIADAYERLKHATRGQAVTREALSELIRGLDAVPANERARLAAMTPESYVGIAARLAREFAASKKVERVERAPLS